MYTFNAIASVPFIQCSKFILQKTDVQFVNYKNWKKNYVSKNQKEYRAYYNNEALNFLFAEQNKISKIDLNFYTMDR